MLDRLCFFAMDIAAWLNSWSDDAVAADWGPPYELGVMYGRNRKGEPAIRGIRTG